MTLWCCATLEREEKSGRIMRALEAGWPGARACVGRPPVRDDPFVVWGQIWLAEEMIREALQRSTKFYQIDNGFYKSARGTPTGYYRFMYCRPDPVLFLNYGLRRRRVEQNPELKVKMEPWRKVGRHVLVAMPGPDFGRAFGIDVPAWSRDVVRRVKLATDRPVLVRERTAKNPIQEDLAGAWVMVTHSSNVAVEAVVRGIPAFVEETSMARPLGNTDISKIERPYLMDREDWWESLMCQQFSIPEMRDGVAAYYLSAVAEQHASSVALLRATASIGS